MPFASVIEIAVSAVAIGILVTTLATGDSPPPNAQLLLWGGHRIFLGELSVTSAELGQLLLKELALNPPTKSVNAASSVGSQVALLVLPSNTEDQVLILLDVRSGQVRAQVSGHGRAVALAPDRARVAFTVPQSGATFDIVLWDIQASTTKTIVRSQPGAGWSLAWKPMSNIVAFDSADGWIYTASMVDGRVSPLVEGENPAWAPDGGRLTFRRRQTVYVYETATGATRPLHTRRWWLWQSKLDAGPSTWSPDGRFVVWNGQILHDIECLFISADSGKVHRVYKGPYWCGPWVDMSDLGH